MHTEQFAKALKEHAPDYGVQPDARVVEALCDYYEIVRAWNARLHLVAPCPAAEFATRHVLESLLAVKYLDEGAWVADIGSGGGLPIIPCLIARADIRATLIEASPKKSVFLREALRASGVRERAEVLAARFEQTPAPAANFVTCRALERFTASLSKIVAWAPANSTLLLFGGPALQSEIEKAQLSYTAQLIHNSEQRFIFIISPRSQVSSPRSKTGS
ncbi:MAG: 16S rRNA (guanine(527)-N(7))-methyltransferase RsmG [Acidobacteria bacterium]|nr:16S rRNA (guanine(527)-N(7))-methyltransferase RsmG [Acidobacteriota bacterium]